MCHQEKIIEIFSGTLWEAEMIRTLLTDAGIDSFLKNTTINSYAFEPIQSEGVQVMILAGHADKAKLIIEDYLGHKKSP